MCCLPKQKKSDHKTNKNLTPLERNQIIKVFAFFSKLSYSFPLRTIEVAEKLFIKFLLSSSWPLTADRGWAPPPLGAHTHQDWRRTSPDKIVTEGAFANSLFRKVPRPATPEALRSPRGHINRPFLRLAAVGALGALVVFCRIGGKSPERSRFRHEGQPPGKRFLSLCLCPLHIIWLSYLVEPSYRPKLF